MKKILFSILIILILILSSVVSAVQYDSDGVMIDGPIVGEAKQLYYSDITLISDGENMEIIEEEIDRPNFFQRVWSSMFGGSSLSFISTTSSSIASGSYSCSFSKKSSSLSHTANVEVKAGSQCNTGQYILYKSEGGDIGAGQYLFNNAWHKSTWSDMPYFSNYWVHSKTFTYAYYCYDCNIGDTTSSEPGCLNYNKDACVSTSNSQCDIDYTFESSCLSHIAPPCLSGAGPLLPNQEYCPDTNPCDDSYSNKCYNEDIYRYDNCNNRISLIKDCNNVLGCNENSGTCNFCGLIYSNKCLGDELWKYDDCGSRISLVQDCGQPGCSNSACNPCDISSNNECYNNDIYSYNACGQLGNKVTECGVAGCTLGNIQCNTCNSAPNRCFDNNVYSYDSCDIKGVLVETCTNTGCTDGICNEPLYTGPAIIIDSAQSLKHQYEVGEKVILQGVATIMKDVSSGIIESSLVYEGYATKFSTISRDSIDSGACGDDITTGVTFSGNTGDTVAYTLKMTAQTAGDFIVKVVGAEGCGLGLPTSNKEVEFRITERQVLCYVCDESTGDISSSTSLGSCTVGTEEIPLCEKPLPDEVTCYICDESTGVVSSNQYLEVCPVGTFESEPFCELPGYEKQCFACNTVTGDIEIEYTFVECSEGFTDIQPSSCVIEPPVVCVGDDCDGGIESPVCVGGEALCPPFDCLEIEGNCITICPLGEDCSDINPPPKTGSNNIILYIVIGLVFAVLILLVVFWKKK